MSRGYEWALSRRRLPRDVRASREQGRVARRTSTWENNRRLWAFGQVPYPHPVEASAERDTCPAHPVTWPGHAHERYGGCLIVTEEHYPPEVILRARAWLLEQHWTGEWERLPGEIDGWDAWSVAVLIEARYPGGWAGFLGLRCCDCGGPLEAGR